MFLIIFGGTNGQDVLIHSHRLKMPAGSWDRSDICNASAAVSAPPPRAGSDTCEHLSPPRSQRTGRKRSAETSHRVRRRHEDALPRLLALEAHRVRHTGSLVHYCPCGRNFQLASGTSSGQIVLPSASNLRRGPCHDHRAARSSCVLRLRQVHGHGQSALSPVEDAVGVQRP